MHRRNIPTVRYTKPVRRRWRPSITIKRKSAGVVPATGSGFVGKLRPAGNRRIAGRLHATYRNMNACPKQAVRNERAFRSEPAGNPDGFYFAFFSTVSQPVTRKSFLCIVNLKNKDYGNSLQNQVQTLRNGVSAQHVGRLRPLSGVCRMLLVTRRNRYSDPLPFVPACAQPHAAGVQRTGRGGDDVGLTLRRKIASEGLNPAPKAHFSEIFSYL